MKNTFFQKQLSQTEFYNNCIKYIFKKLFAKKIIGLFTNIKLDKYVYTIYSNQNNYKLNNILGSNNKNKDHENENIERKRPPDNLSKFYGIYN